MGENNPGALSVVRSKGHYNIKGADFEVRFSRMNGALDGFDCKGVQYVKGPLLPHFSRPLTDNDRRGWKADERLAPWYHPEIRLQRLRIDSVVNAKGRMTDVIIHSDYSLLHGKAFAEVDYHIFNKGYMHVQFNFRPVIEDLPDLPKVGMQMQIDSSFSNVNWYGRGPLGNYIDRRTGFMAGIYQLPLKSVQFNEPYVVPQETGNRTDVRWMRFSSPKTHEQGGALKVIADSLLSMSAWPYSEQNINAARHTIDLKPTAGTTLNIDLVQMGVGGNDSWSIIAKPLDKYMIAPKKYQYGFYLSVEQAND
jgi:beta-galactosidase